MIQWMILPFMIIAGTNFALFWHAFDGRPERLFENTEFRAYVKAFGGVAAILFVLLVTGIGMAEIPVNVGRLTGSVEASARHALFQSLTIVTTTGYASMGFNAWSQPTQTVLLFAMFLGGVRRLRGRLDQDHPMVRRQAEHPARTLPERSPDCRHPDQDRY